MTFSPNSPEQAAVEALRRVRAEAQQAVDRTGGMVRSGSFGPDRTAGGNGSQITILVVGGAMLIGCLTWALTRNQSPVASPELGYALLQNQQAMNDRLLQGQQELSAQMIQAQKTAKPSHITVNCFATRYCPGSIPGGDQDWAVMGEGVSTARVNPNQAQPPQEQLVQPQQAHPPQEQPIESQPVGYVSPEQAWNEHYQRMQVQQPDRLNYEHDYCIKQDWQPVSAQVNCPALSIFLGGKV